MKKIFYTSIMALSLCIIPPQAFAKHHKKIPQPIPTATTQPMYRGMHKINKSIFPPIPLSPNIQCGLVNINTKYQNALQAIAASDLSQPLRQLLIEQATQNREFATRVFIEKMQLCAQQAHQRMKYHDELIKGKDNKEIINAIRATDCI